MSAFNRRCPVDRRIQNFHDDGSGIVTLGLDDVGEYPLAGQCPFDEHHPPIAVTGQRSTAGGHRSRLEDDIGAHRVPEPPPSLSLTAAPVDLHSTISPE